MICRRVILSTIAWSTLWLGSVLAALWLLDWPIYWLSDFSFFHAQFSAGFPLFAICVSFFITCLSLFTWYFHKNFLHRISTSFMRKWPVPFRWMYPMNLKFYTSHHLQHHVRVNIGDYVIKTEDQTKSMKFPFWALIGFIGFFSPVLFVIQAFIPATVPIVVSGYIACFIFYLMYECSHAMFHADETVWKKYMDRPNWIGSAATWCYEYHKQHHRDHNTNLDIPPIPFLPWDWLMGTREKAT